MAELDEVVVMAPNGNCSAAAHSLTLDRPLRIRQVKPDWYTSDGTPSDCVHLALNGLLREKRPVLTACGINKGGNMGQDITYSGTVMAALEATLIGVPAFAVSVDARENFDFSGAADIARRVAREMLRAGLPSGTLLNVNVPNEPAARIKGVRLTRLGRRVYGDEIQKRLDPRGKTYYWIAGQELGFENIEGSDMVAVREGYASLTPLSCDMTSEEMIRMLEKRSW